MVWLVLFDVFWKQARIQNHMVAVAEPRRLKLRVIEVTSKRWKFYWNTVRILVVNDQRENAFTWAWSNHNLEVLQLFTFLQEKDDMISPDVQQLSALLRQEADEPFYDREAARFELWKRKLPWFRVQQHLADARFAWSYWECLFLWY